MIDERPPLVTFLLRIADDNLVLAQRLGELISWMPELEEDIAIANLSLDHLGQATAFLGYAAELTGTSDADQLAMTRNEREFLNSVMVERPNGDFGQTMARQFFVDAYQAPFYRALADSADERIAGVAAKAEKESRYHLEYSSSWLTRLGDGTEESHRRMQAGIDQMWPFVDDLFATDDIEIQLRVDGIAPELVDVRRSFDETVTNVFASARLSVPADPYQRLGGRRGFHSEHLGPLLAEMQSLYRAMPGVSW
ncbi:MAG: 1,2-phenylacetyl-CoA epoxidase subunit PaaC [Acidimicrobiia bacterium]|nr:1,2-phenylacetyl-CoA epoxidase subunit PaaC [Acidimicrobiia bacterium]